MEVSVLTLRDLASGRPGRRGRAEAAQKVSGEGGRGVLAPSNVNPVLPVRSTARVRGQREDRGGGGQPGPQRVCPPPPPPSRRVEAVGVRNPGPGDWGAWRRAGPACAPRIVSLSVPMAAFGGLPMGTGQLVCPAASYLSVPGAQGCPMLPLR